MATLKIVYDYFSGGVFKTQAWMSLYIEIMFKEKTLKALNANNRI